MFEDVVVDVGFGGKGLHGALDGRRQHRVRAHVSQVAPVLVEVPPLVSVADVERLGAGQALRSAGAAHIESVAMSVRLKLRSKQKFKKLLQAGLMKELPRVTGL